MLKRILNFELTACFTGHRIIPAAEREKIEANLDKAIDDAIEKGVKRFICGGAIGFDTMAAKAVLKKKQTNDIVLEIAVPCRDQADKWSKKQQLEYQEILTSADKVTYLFDKFVTGCMHFRDAFMVDNSDILIAYYRGRAGGTQYTFLYAESRGLEIINI